jgi:hypothetical protein
VYTKVEQTKKDDGEGREQRSFDMIESVPMAPKERTMST